MAHQGIGYMDQQPLQPEFGRHERNHLELSVRHCAFFFLFSGASIMVVSIGASSVNREHIFVGFLLFILGSVLWLLQAFLLHRSLMAMMVAGFVVAAFRKLFIARN